MCRAVVAAGARESGLESFPALTHPLKPKVNPFLPRVHAEKSNYFPLQAVHKALKTSLMS